MWKVIVNSRVPVFIADRMLRQGVLPFPKFWATTWPFGTPSGPYFVKWALTLLMILAPPAGDAFNFSKFDKLGRTISLQV